jgi:hypothetical protein
MQKWQRSLGGARAAGCSAKGQDKISLWFFLMLVSHFLTSPLLISFSLLSFDYYYYVFSFCCILHIHTFKSSESRKVRIAYSPTQRGLVPMPLDSVVQPLKSQPRSPPQFQRALNFSTHIFRIQS